MNASLKLEGKAWSNFIDTETSTKTKELYSWWVCRFIQYCKLNSPQDLLELGTPNEIEDRVIDWIGHLKDENKSSATMSGAMASIVFFYSCNRVRLDTKFIGRRIPKKPALPHRSPTKEEIAILMEHTNQRGRALIGILASTGVRVGSIPNMKIRHRRRAKPEELEHHDCACKDRSIPLRFDGYILDVYPGESEAYFSFISEEASKWLDSYHKTRENAGEILVNNNPLFRDEFDIKNDEVVMKPSVFKLASIMNYLYNLGVASGLKPKIKAGKGCGAGNRHEWKRAHGFRMFFSTSATNAGVNFSFKELMLGHHLNLEKSYYDSNNPRSVHAALAEYLKMQDAVTLFSTSRLERENSILKIQNSEMTSMQDVIRTLPDRIAELERNQKGA